MSHRACSVALLVLALFTPVVARADDDTVIVERKITLTKSSALQTSEVDAVIAGSYAIAPCFSGDERVKVRIDVSPEGIVRSAKAKARKPVKACLEAAFKRTRFPKAAGRTTATI